MTCEVDAKRNRVATPKPAPSGSDGTSNQRKVLDRGVTQGRPVAQRTPAVYSGKYAFDGGFDE